MALNIGAIFDGKLSYAFKNDMRNLANFHQSMFESLKIGTLRDPFIQSRKRMGLKFDKFCPEHSEIPKSYTLIGCF